MAKERPTIRGSTAMKLLSACCGGILLSMPGVLVDALKMVNDYRTGDDLDSDTNCGEFALWLFSSQAYSPTSRGKPLPRLFFDLAHNFEPFFGPLLLYRW